MRLLLAFLILATCAAACNPGPQRTDPTPTPNPTAVFGAHEWQLQREAIERENVK